MRHWTFSAKLALALILMVVLTVVVGGMAAYWLRAVVADKDEVIEVNAANLTRAERVNTFTQQRRGMLRDYLLTPNAEFTTQLQRLSATVREAMEELERNGADVGQLRLAERGYQEAVERIVAQRRMSLEAGLTALNEAVSARTAMEQSAQDLADRQRSILEARRQAATERADRAITTIVAVVFAAAIGGVIAAVALTRALTREIGSAVQHVQSSATELQTAANQQASSSKEQATAMAEITTTISELLATSRQIAESAQRVARIAEETASAGRGGEETVRQGGEAIDGIRRQVDTIVTHMLDLGRKSQEIGGILEIITELADQTNILAVNAAIEAAGAGEAGRRFGVVAEEIRKLADRVAGSTKEIRTLIQDMRAAVNASVMSTETASKTVTAGTTHFAGVSTSFREISTLVRTTNEAAREIELSTKQQATAVEQVNRGVADVAQAARETEVTSAQMLDTVSQLATLSHSLSRLVTTSALV